VIKTAVARRYARALFELLEPAHIEATRGTLNSLGQALKDSEALRYVIASPAVGIEDKIVVLNELAGRLGSPPTGQAFLAQLVKKNRVGFLPEIAEAFSRFVDESKGTQHVLVSSASALPSSEQDRIRTRLRETLRRDVDVTFQTDASQLAGLHIQIGSMVVDSTVRGRLNSLRTALTRE
jgi:F-type H+-transporting ATPase subunit delta